MNRGGNTPLARRRQRGVAIITALLLTALAITIVASLFWQQQVQVRSMENQRLHLQTKWILRGALDWARLILREDGRIDGKVTALDGIWATPVAETRLDDYVERERVDGENYNATLSGQMTDAQARYNLTNLAATKVPDTAQVKAFQRLLTNVQIDPGLAQAAAQAVADSMPAGSADASVDPTGLANGGGGTGTSTATGTALSATSASNAGGQSGKEPMPFMQVEDLLSVAGFTSQNVQRLREFLIVLPSKTKLNVNTASAEVLSAVLDVPISQAAVLVSARKTAHFAQLSEMTSLLGGAAQIPVKPDEVAEVVSRYFLVQSHIRLDHAALDAEALMQRQNSNPFKTTLIWIREN